MFNNRLNWPKSTYRNETTHLELIGHQVTNELQAQQVDSIMVLVRKLFNSPYAVTFFDLFESGILDSDSLSSDGEEGYSEAGYIKLGGARHLKDQIKTIKTALSNCTDSNLKIELRVVSGIGLVVTANGVWLAAGSSEPAVWRQHLQSIMAQELRSSITQGSHLKYHLDGVRIAIPGEAQGNNTERASDPDRIIRLEPANLNIPQSKANATKPEESPYVFFPKSDGNSYAGGELLFLAKRHVELLKIIQTTGGYIQKQHWVDAGFHLAMFSEVIKELNAKLQALFSKPQISSHGNGYSWGQRDRRLDPKRILLNDSIPGYQSSAVGVVNLASVPCAEQLCRVWRFDPSYSGVRLLYPSQDSHNSGLGCIVAIHREEGRPLLVEVTSRQAAILETVIKHNITGDLQDLQQRKRIAEHIPELGANEVGLGITRLKVAMGVIEA